MIFIVEKLCCW